MKNANLFLPVFVFVVVAVSVQAQSFLTNALVAYYPFNGDANDASGHGNNGVIHGATLATNRFGTPNSAFAFNGVQNYIQVPETIFGGSAAAVTISAWVTTDTNSYAGNEQIFEKSSINGEMELYVNANQFFFGPVLSNPYGGIDIGTPLRSNCVTHLVGVYQQGQGIWLYTNGVLANVMTGIPNSTLWVNAGYSLASAIGIYDFASTPFNAFHGVIDDVRVYTRALSAAEVQQLYQGEGSNQQPGFALGLYAGVTVSGVVGFTYAIQSNPDLAQTNGWTTVTNLTLTQPVQIWVDTTTNVVGSANQHLFYRVLPGH